jgi:hypothetical protein
MIVFMKVSYCCQSFNIFEKVMLVFRITVLSKLNESHFVQNEQIIRQFNILSNVRYAARESATRIRAYISVTSETREDVLLRVKDTVQALPTLNSFTWGRIIHERVTRSFCTKFATPRHHLLAGLSGRYVSVQLRWSIASEGFSFRKGVTWINWWPISTKY